MGTVIFHIYWLFQASLKKLPYLPIPFSNVWVLLRWFAILWVKIKYLKYNWNMLVSTEVGSSLLRHPSPELSRLISAHGSLSKGERNFQWPVLAFVIQHHDLEGLEVAMKHALRKSACRVFAMEVSDIPSDIPQFLISFLFFLAKIVQA